MLSELLVNEDTLKEINTYLLSVTGGIVLLGDKGIGKFLCARSIACSILGCTEIELEIHPDFYLVSAEDRVVRIEQILKLKNRASLVASKGEKKVFIVDDADCMSVSAQNAVLKLLEDNNDTNVLIFVSEHKLLETIHSRATTIRFMNPSMDELRAYLKDEKISDVALLMSGGRIGLYYNIVNDCYLLSDLERILNTFSGMNKKRELLEAFCILKEKDKNSFYEKHDIFYVYALFSLLREIYINVLQSFYGESKTYNFIDCSNIQKLYSATEITVLIPILGDHLLRMKRKGSYNTNDFFDLIRAFIA